MTQPEPTVTYDVYRLVDSSSLIKFQIQLEIGVQPEELAEAFSVEDLDEVTVGEMHRFAARADVSDQDVYAATDGDRRFLAAAIEFALGTTGNDSDVSRGIAAPESEFLTGRQYTEFGDLMLRKFDGVSPYIRLQNPSAPEPQRVYEVVVPVSLD